MGVCLSKPSRSSPRVDARGGSAATRVDESFVDAEPIAAVFARSRRAGQVAADGDAGTNNNEPAPQRRKTVADDSEAMDTAASGSNPTTRRGRNVGYVDAPPRLRVFSRVFPAIFPRSRVLGSTFVFFR
jgi:hypothetical protein